MTKKAPLKLLHKRLKQTSLTYWDGKSTDEIIESLKPEAVEPLIAKDDGTVMQGNHRISVLMKRRHDIDGLPRVQYPNDK